MEVNIKWLNKSGIYKITCNNLSYIGSSVDLYHRIAQHISNLKRNRHHSKYMQHCFEKYGESAFNIEILEYLERDIKTLREREEWYMNTNNCEFNSTTPVTYIHSEETKKRIAESIKQLWKNNPELNPRLDKGHRMWAYDYQGVIIAENKKPEELVNILGYSNRAVFNGAIRQGRPIIGKKHIVLLNNDWEILYDWIKKQQGKDIPLYKISLDGKITKCSTSSKIKVIDKVLNSKDFVYYSSIKKSFYTFIGLIEQCRLREEIPQIITAELSKEGEIPNLN